MINQKFMKNWQALLKYNANVGIIEEDESKKQMVDLPLTTINVRANVLYYLFKFLYPKFINDQQNILDVIISDDGNEILKIILYKTKKPGIHESFQILSNDIIDIQLKNIKILAAIDEKFSIIQSSIIKEIGVRISSIRIFKNRAIEVINEYYEDIAEKSFYEILNQFFDLIQNLFEHDIFYTYPRPNIYSFIKEIIKLLDGVKLSRIFEFIYSIYLDFNTAIVLSSKELNLILHIRKKTKGKKSEFTFNLLTAEDLSIKIDDLSTEKLMKIIQVKLRSNNVYFLSQNNLVNLLLDIVELDFPVEQGSIRLLLQKVLFGIRSFENIWYMTPRPRVYNNLIRFFVRMLGINLNLKKISHWAIPELIFNSFDSYFGLNYKLLVILTSIIDKNIKKVNYLNNYFENAFLLEIENKKLVKINSIRKNELFTPGLITSLENIRSNTSKTYGFISAVMNIDKSLLREVINSFGPKLSKFKIFSNSKTYKMLKKKRYFNIYPELPPYKLIKENGMISLFKMFLPIFIDKHEF